MEIIAAIAIGLNPYVGTFLLSSLGAFTAHLQGGPLLGFIPGPLLSLLVVLCGLAMPIDFVLAKFVRFAPRVRRVSQYVAPAAGAFAAAALTNSRIPLPIVACGAAILSWAVSAMLTAAAARASRSADWVGLGHIPIFMAAATAAACIVPLALVKPAIGLGVAGASLAALVWPTAAALRPGRRRAPARRRMAIRSRLVV